MPPLAPLMVGHYNHPSLLVPPPITSQRGITCQRLCPLFPLHTEISASSVKNTLPNYLQPTIHHRWQKTYPAKVNQLNIKNSSSAPKRPPIAQCICCKTREGGWVSSQPCHCQSDTGRGFKYRPPKPCAKSRDTPWPRSNTRMARKYRLALPPCKRPPRRTKLTRLCSLLTWP